VSPEVRAQYKADMARCRAERDAYRKRAAFQWKERTRLNAKRQWLEALKAMDRHHEYKNTAAQYDAEVKRIKEIIS
jgi:hypothetical protein